MGGAFCTGTTEKEIIKSCIDRADSPLGSNKEWPTQLDSFVGILDSNPKNNDFYNWNHVIIMYCDGAFHQGYRK